MYNVLVVDDEIIAIRGIVQGIDWSELPIANMFTALDAEEARDILSKNQIHVIVSDIDMPKENGIKLLKWVNENSPRTVTIFLTGHADFVYAQQAVQMNCFEYLLKPIDHDLLKESVVKALDLIETREQEGIFLKTYEHYYDQWNRQLPILIERFWQDVLNLRIPATAERLEPLFKLYGMKLDMDMPVLPLLISVERWRQEWSARDEEIMTYALKNAAEDILLKDWEGHVVQEQNGMIFTLMYGTDGPIDQEALQERCAEYIGKCGDYLHAEVSCYIGEAVPVPRLRMCTHNLADMERSNLSETRSVFRMASFTRSNKRTYATPNLQEWISLVERGKKAELLKNVNALFDQWQAEQANYMNRVNFYYGLVNSVFQLLGRRSLFPSDVFVDEEWRNGEQALKSLGAMKTWTIRFLERLAEYMATDTKEVSNVVVKVQQFIEKNVNLEMNRDEIAEQVYLNPAYLSRLFRKETGKSLTDYMSELRVEKAKRQLVKSNIKISDIAISVGYSNFSHFSQLFKKLTGVTPQEYRKKYQDLR